MNEAKGICISKIYVIINKKKTNKFAMKWVSTKIQPKGKKATHLRPIDGHKTIKWQNRIKTTYSNVYRFQRYLARSFRITVFYFPSANIVDISNSFVAFNFLLKCIFTIDSFHKFSFKAIIKFINCSHAYKLVDQFDTFGSDISIEICIFIFAKRIFDMQWTLLFDYAFFLLLSNKKRTY